MSLWNPLPQRVMEAELVNIFKTEVVRFFNSDRLPEVGGSMELRLNQFHFNHSMAEQFWGMEWHTRSPDSYIWHCRLKIFMHIFLSTLVNGLKVHKLHFWLKYLCGSSLLVAQSWEWTSCAFNKYPRNDGKIQVYSQRAGGHPRMLFLDCLGSYVPFYPSFCQF